MWRSPDNLAGDIFAPFKTLPCSLAIVSSTSIVSANERSL